MAEIKRNFTAGKMNKDFDERIIPQGEYVDAMNVQVSTSEGSDIGTIQNILGNSIPSSSFQSKIAKGSKCIGSIADEKNSYIYWFTAQDTFQSAYGFNEEGVQVDNNPEIYIVEGLNYQGQLQNIFHSDFLTKHRKEGIYRLYTGDDIEKEPFNPVFIDDAGVTTTIFSGNPGVLGDSQRDKAIEMGYSGLPDPTYPYLIQGLGYHTQQPKLEIYDGEKINVGDKLELWGILEEKAFNYASDLDHPIYVKSKKLINIWIDNDGNSKYHYELILSCANPNHAILYTLIWDPYKKNKDGTKGVITSSLEEDMATYFPTHPDSKLIAENVTHISFVSEVLELNPNKQITGINIIDDMLFWTDGFSEPKKINISRSIEGTDESGTIHTRLINENAKINPYNPNFNNIFQTSNNIPVLPSRIKLSTNIDGIIQVGMRVTCASAVGFPCNVLNQKIITVIEIDPDNDDPNQVLISEDLNASLGIGLELNFNWDIPVRKEHITVIKPSPKSQLHLDLSLGRDQDKTYSAMMTISNPTSTFLSSFDNTGSSFTRYDFGGLNADGWDAPGNWNNAQFVVNLVKDKDGNDTFDLAAGGWASGKEVVIREFNSDGTPPSTPIANNEYIIKGVLSISHAHKFNASTGDPANVQIVVKEVLGTPPSTSSGTINFLIDLYDASEETLFKFKFPRFSCRYKYEDGEYSSFAPWTQIAFVPGNFDYHPKKGYNLGMTNRLKNLKISNFITQDLPKDVIEIDILYKEDAAPEIYVVDTIRVNDEPETADNDLNVWELKELEITNDTIHAVVPSNQILRHYDNVPKKALAQEIIGNRIVYGNYTQGYNLTSKGTEISPKFKYTIEQSPVGSVRSIKSLRDYKLGVIFIDRYGRETPVISNKSGEFKVDKASAKNRSRIKVGLQGNNIPNNMESVKFFIKETSGEYYNLAMDRFYDAEDDNVWLAFPSSDRNKIDIDTYLILKKGVESNELVEDPARYKVLAIENEAPDFVKTETRLIGRLNENGDLFDGDSFPKVGQNTFTCSESRLQGSSLVDIHEIEDDLHVEFFNSNESRTSKKYLITAVGKKDTGGNYEFTIDGFFEEEDLCNNTRVYTGPCSVPGGFKTSIQVRFYKSVVKNSPKFDGRFFVKIFADEIFKDNINNGIIDLEAEDFTTVASKKIYYLTDWQNGEDKHSRNGYMIFNNDDYWKSSVMVGMEDIGPNDNGDGWNDHDNKMLYHQQPALMHAFLAGNENHMEYHYQKWRAYFKHNVAALFKGRDPGTHDYFLNVSDKNPNSSKYTAAGLWPALGAAGASTSGQAISIYSGRGNAPGLDYTTDLVHNIAHDQAMRFFKHESDPSLDGFEDVVFIDAGTYVNAHIQGAPVRWIGFGDLDHLDHNEYHTNYGIHHWDNGTGGKIDLGLGPIFPEATTNCADGCHQNWQHSDYNFWDPMERSEWDGTDTKRLLSNVIPSQMFRWEEDPSGQVFVINAQINYRNKIRFSSLDKNNANGNQKDILKNPYMYTSENYTKNMEAYFEPKMEWDPTNGGLEGTIPTGRVIKTSYNASTTSPPTSEALKGYFVDNTVVISEDMFEGTIDTGNHSNKNTTISIYPGLALTRVEGGTDATASGSDGHGNNGVVNDTNDYLHYPVIVKSITKDGSNYILELTGYNTIRPGLSSSTGAYVYTPLCFGPGTGCGTITTGIFTDTTATYTLTFEQLAMNGLSVNSANNINNYNPGGDNFFGIQAVGYTMEIVEPVEVEAILPENPAIWETEPKDSTDLDIYYEISESFPLELNANTIDSAIPIGSKIKTFNNAGILINNPAAPALISSDVEVTSHLTAGIYGIDGNVIRLNNWICIDAAGCIDSAGATITPILEDSILKIVKPSGVEFGVVVEEAIIDNAVDFNSAGSGGYDGLVGMEFKLKPSLFNANYTLNWYNCFSFGNGVESNRIRDSFNLPYISSGVKASTTFANKYIEEHRATGLIYSGIYNSTSGVNNLNQFIAGEKITKDINPIYGSIQKLHTRDTDLVTLCENKILKILASKDALYNADGNPQLIATQNVLGQAVPFVGEYGISKNPESFVSEAYRAYFSDKTRGAILRLSRDGLTPISEHGMRDWFRDNLKLSKDIIGSYDDKHNEYNVSLQGTKIKKTVSFKEDIKGWVSFKSFIPESGLSCSNNYYTFKGGKAWQHGLSDEIYNRFYNNTVNSHVTLILNEQPSLIKSFKTLNYEGTQSRVIQVLDENNNIVNDGEYYNVLPKKGWFVEDIHTDKQEGSVNEFIEKEGKWFNYIKGKQIVTSAAGKIITSQIQGGGDFDQASFAMQGLGGFSNYTISQISGCTHPSAFNYDPNAVIDDGSCVPITYGCMDPSANNYNQVANVSDPTMCLYHGCMDPTANNYDPNANVNDGSCWYTIYGCTNPSSFNYDPNANTNDPDNPCYPVINGCMATTADNYVPLVNDVTIDVNTEDGTCVWQGCTLDDASNTTIFPAEAIVYSPQNQSYGIQEDFSCLGGGCMDNGDVINNPNYIAGSGTASSNQDWWEGLNVPSWQNLGPAYQVIYNVGSYPGVQANNYDPNALFDDYYYSQAATGSYGGCDYDTGCTIPYANNYNPNVTIDDGSCEIHGCMDPTALNFDCAIALHGANPQPPFSPCTDGVTFNHPTYCVYTDYGCTDAFACNYDSYANTPCDASGSAAGNNECCDYSSCAGCTDATALNYNDNVGDPAGFSDECYIIDSSTGLPSPLAQCTIPCGDGTSSIPNAVPNCCNLPQAGCMDPIACNYDAGANVAATCDYTSCAGCTDPNYTDYCSSCSLDCNADPIGTQNAGWDSCCQNAIIVGCMDPDSCIYNPSANTPPVYGQPFYNPNISPGDSNAIKQGCIYTFDIVSIGDATNNSFPETTTSSPDGIIAPYWYEQVPPIAHNASTLQHFVINQPGDVDIAIRTQYKGDIDTLNYQLGHVSDMVILELHEEVYNSQGQVVYTQLRKQKFYQNPSAQVPNSPTDLTNGGYWTWGNGDTDANNEALEVYKPNSTPSQPQFKPYVVRIMPLKNTPAWTSDEQAIIATYGICFVDKTFTFPYSDCTQNPNSYSGCTNSTACNYDPGACSDDGSCYYGTQTLYYASTGCNAGPSCDPGDPNDPAYTVQYGTPTSCCGVNPNASGCPSS